MTAPGPVPAARPAASALLFAAGLLSLSGAVFAILSQFGRVFGDQPFVRDIASYRWYYGALAVGLVVAGLLLTLRRTTQVAGAVMLVVLVATFASFPVRAAAAVMLDPGFDGGSTIWLSLATLGLAGVGALIAAVSLLARAHGAPAAPIDTRRVGLAALGASAGFVTAVGFAMNPAALDVPGYDPPQANVFQGSLPRSVWAQVLVISVLVLASFVAAFASRAVAVGVTAGLGVFAVGELAFRFEIGHATGLNVDSYRRIEGTWWFAIGAVLLLTVLSVRIAVGDP